MSQTTETTPGSSSSERRQGDQPASAARKLNLLVVDDNQEVGESLAMLLEASLSFLGIGVPPPTPTWGQMLGDAQALIWSAPLQAVWPGVAIAVAVLGFNLLGDGLRDLLDPRLREVA